MPAGRPITVNQKEDVEYFKKYYHLTKEEFKCECGSSINNHSRLKHLKSYKHIRVMDLLEKLKEKEGN